jgi:hypothetical protein
VKQALRRGMVPLLAAACLCTALAMPAASAETGAGTGQAGVGATLTASTKYSFDSYPIVVYSVHGYATATLSGQAVGGAAGEHATLLAQPFPYISPFAPLGTPVTLSGSGSYTFKAKPVIATRYEVQITPAGAPGKVLATSPPDTVYVSTFYSTKLTKGAVCSRPVCRFTDTVKVKVPPLSYGTEVAKRVYGYLGYRLSATSTPPRPTIMTYDPAARVSPPSRLSATEFEFTISFAYRIGPTDGASSRINFCTKDAYLTDGLGLPGRHGCGAPQVSVSQTYLG